MSWLGLLFVLGVLMGIAWRLRPIKHIRMKSNGSTWISRNRREGFDWSRDDKPRP